MEGGLALVETASKSCRNVKTISVCLPIDLVDKLRHGASSWGVSVSAYTTMALRTGIAHFCTDVPEKEED